MKRREFLRGASASMLGLLVTGLTGCGGVGPVPFQQLSARLQGPLVLPGTSAYPQFTQVYNSLYNEVRPAAVAICQTVEDVRQCILFCRSHGVPLAARSGGHSFAGYSTTPGLLIDVTSMNSVSVDNGAIAVVGGGARNRDVRAGLVSTGFYVPGGTCPTVGVSGLVAGGGLGMSRGLFGLSCDALLEAQIVLASGDILVCNAQQNADLFWALRGGGGGNFGVTTQFEFRTYAVDRVSTFECSWDWRAAASVFSALQTLATMEPDELTFQWSVKSDGNPTISAFGQYIGPQGQLEDLLAPVFAAARPTTARIQTLTFWEAQTLWEPNPPSSPFLRKSHYVRDTLSSSAIQTILTFVQNWPGSANPAGGGVSVYGWGGAVSRVPAGAMAFAHRDSGLLILYSGFWQTTDTPAVVSGVVDWVTSFHAAMRPYVSPFAFQNFIDPTLDNWKEAYYGANFARLVRVKKAFDPDNLFQYAQSIPTIL